MKLFSIKPKRSLRQHVEWLKEHLELHEGTVVATPHASASLSTPWGAFASCLVAEVSRSTGRPGVIVVFDVGKVSDNRYEPGRWVLPFGKKVRLLRLGKKKWSKLFLPQVDKAHLREKSEVLKEVEQAWPREFSFPPLGAVIEAYRRVYATIAQSSAYHLGVVEAYSKYLKDVYPHLFVFSFCEVVREQIDFFIEVIRRAVRSSAYANFLVRVGDMGRKYRSLLNEDPPYELGSPDSFVRLREDLEQGLLLPSIAPFMAYLLEVESVVLHIGGEHMIHYVVPLMDFLHELGFDTSRWAYFHVGRATVAAFANGPYQREVDYMSWKWAPADKEVCQNAMLLPVSLYTSLPHMFQIALDLPYKALFEQVPLLVQPPGRLVRDPTP